MKIGPKIALFYSLITMCAIIMVMSVFYLFSSRYINRLYESYLREKAFITAQKYWEKDEVDEQSYRLIQQKYDEHVGTRQGHVGKISQCQSAGKTFSW